MTRGVPTGPYATVFAGYVTPPVRREEGTGPYDEEISMMFGTAALMVPTATRSKRKTLTRVRLIYQAPTGEKPILRPLLYRCPVIPMLCRQSPPAFGCDQFLSSHTRARLMSPAGLLA